MDNKLITLGAGCFWCVEAIFKDLKGVTSVASGYMGGHIKNPAYREVCNGTTGHAEVVQLTYNPSVISLDNILNVFWTTHDPTTLNQQGADKGTQYRSAIFYHDDKQLLISQKSKEQADSAEIWPNPIVTEITKASTFYAADEYHQNYFDLNPNQGYCRVVINPKVAKFRTKFSHLLKS